MDPILLIPIILIAAVLVFLIALLFEQRAPVRMILELVRARQLSPQLQGKVWKPFDETPAVIKRGVYVCPNCYGRRLSEGPGGGLSTNVECQDCLHRWNANPLGMPWMFIGLSDLYNATRVAANMARKRAERAGIPIVTARQRTQVALGRRLVTAWERRLKGQR